MSYEYKPPSGTRIDVTLKLGVPEGVGYWPSGRGLVVHGKGIDARLIPWGDLLPKLEGPLSENAQMRADLRAMLDNIEEGS